MPKATIDDVARLAGVSIKTVSRVVNREPNVRETTRTRVESAIAELDYRPNPSARNLASRRSHLIVLVYDDPGVYEIPSAGYVINIQQGVLAACKKASHELLIYPCDYRTRQVSAELKAMISRTRPDGVVLAAPLSNMLKLVRAVEETGTPLARICPGELNGAAGIVATNDREICAGMTQYLASLGHTRIGFIKGHPIHKAVANRFLGYQDGLRQSGLSYSEQLVADGDNSIGSGEACAAILLNGKNRPTAIFAANDDMAAGVIRIAERMKIPVPGQLSVAGFDDIALARQIFPALTTVRQPLVEMAEAAARILIAGDKKGGAPRQAQIIAATLQIRDSTGPVPGHDS